MTAFFGHEDEWSHFGDNHALLLKILVEAHQNCLDLLKAAQLKAESSADKTILAIGLACLKEFEEIVLLSGNGYGSGANKLLRAFYERVITLSYLAKHPDKVQQFVDYSDVHWHKLLAEARQKHADVGLTQKRVEQIERTFEKSKDRYMVNLCKTCGTQRLQGSWTKKPVQDMAADVDVNLRLLYFNAFLRPTFLIHTTFYGVTAVAEKTPEGKIHFFSQKNEKAIAKESIDLAHILLIQAAIALNTYYKLLKDSMLEKMGRDHARVNKS